MTKALKWPDGKQAAAMVSIELDNEFMWLGMDPSCIHAPKVLSNGEFGFNRGFGRVMDALDRYGVKATFFVLGAVAEKYPEKILEVAKAGHEIACHGYLHRDYATLSHQEQEDDMGRAIQVLEKLVGRRPTGFRAPEGEVDGNTIQLIVKNGFRYDSSLLASDMPYWMPVFEVRPSTYDTRYPDPYLGTPSGVVEIPMHWELQDFPYFTYCRRPAFPRGQTSIQGYTDTLYNYLYELDAFYDMGLCYVCKFDPQTIGHGGRMVVFEKVLEALTEKNIWLATGDEIARYAAENMEKD